MQEKRKHWQPLGICHSLFTFIMNSLNARRFVKHVTITSHHPTPQGSSNEVVFVEDQQPLVPNRPNGVESIYIQQAQHTPEDNSGFEIQVHYKQTDDDDSKMRNSSDSHKLSLSKSLQELKPIVTGVSQAKDPEKCLSIADAVGLEKEKDNKKKGIMLMSNEKFTLAMVGEEDERSKLPLMRARPLFYVAPNINEKSDEFIRSRKEAMRRSQSLELPKTY
ncbi:hypothetical protein RchiOBHm_Chr6g0291921 [Rosa chinensis]|uniref:Uncharacterized protein n=1 Tax=Rosa chinensis TaxID=74649 RepID=A0A2P6PWA6_ROSCH|nr:hypothetical protein RchiOBHm_Chr6g0291921 [Rosa chinensis]